MKKFNWFIFTFLAFAFMACEEDEAVLDTEDPTITITAPVSQTEFNPDDAVTLQATVMDNLGLEAVQIWVTPPGGTAQMVFEEPVSDFLNDNTKAVIEETIRLGTTTPAPGSYLIVVQATDEQGNTAEQSVTVIVRELDETAPVILVTTPEDNASFQAGQDFILSGEIEEDMMLSEVIVNVMSSAGTSIFEETITEFEDPTLFNLQDTITIPRDANLGASTIVITTTDQAGNETVEEIPFTVTEPGARITFMLTDIPENTPEEDLFIAGEFANGAWVTPGTDERFMLTDNGDGTYSITLDALTTTETEGVVAYKFAREGGWETVERDADCVDIDNRTVANDGSVTEVPGLVVASWADLCQ
ncbi:DUF4625 domain-containing protein [Nafulsella turpanensis]|uniref:DUF4625 domain-containing protein n=1 Tax=Nafulsella turpanensis TaxID=1265690 RepID=UPI000345205E|nr:DUF4625 domain-containing protein [Nafulsella turpanensis]